MPPVVGDLGGYRLLGLGRRDGDPETVRELGPQTWGGRLQLDQCAQSVEQDGPTPQATNRHVANSAVNRPSSTASEATTGTVIRLLSAHHPAHMKSGKMTMAYREID